MHGILPFLLAMIAAIVLLEMLATKLRVAYPIVLVVAGLLISFIPGLPAIRVNPDLIFFIVLPPLLFEAAWNISFKEMKKWYRIISSFAFLVVLFTALAVAVVANQYIPGFSIALGFLLGGIVSPPDAVSAKRHHEICKNSQVDLHDPRRGKPAERRFIPDHIPVCAGRHRNRTIYLAAGGPEFCVDDHRRPRARDCCWDGFL